MARIACIGWGSLIWQPKELRIRGEWNNDGPVLPLEFSRQSKNERLTLVIDAAAAQNVTTLWAYLDYNEFQPAIKQLKVREDVSLSDIGWLTADGNSNNTADPNLNRIRNWFETIQADAVLWTNLPCKFRDDKGRRPTEDEAVDYLASLSRREDKTAWLMAKQYVECAPAQIDTEYRRRFEQEFGWERLSCR